MTWCLTGARWFQKEEACGPETRSEGGTAGAGTEVHISHLLRTRRARARPALVCMDGLPAFRPPPQNADTVADRLYGAAVDRSSAASSWPFACLGRGCADCSAARATRVLSELRQLGWA